ncbi:MAG: hypothetical protein U1E89_16250 [Burkholderiaceae bacterium]
MNRRRVLWLAPAVCALHVAPARAAVATRPLELDAWPALRASLAGRRAIVHLWGLTCAPCIDELARWAAFIERHPREAIVMIEVEPAEPRLVDAALRRAGVRGGRQYAVRGFADERWQHAIDPMWGGELPRTLMLEAAGSARAFSGPADFDALHRWLAG